MATAAALDPPSAPTSAPSLPSPTPTSAAPPNSNMLPPAPASRPSSASNGSADSVHGASRKTSASPAVPHYSTWHLNNDGQPLGQSIARPANVSSSVSNVPHLNLCAQASSSKRKLDDADADAEESQHKIRRVVRDHLSQDPGRIMSMTTVVCLHAAVAQKSYGSEKRFLCPPPLVRIEGPSWNMRDQQLSMSIVSETGDRSPEQKAPLDTSMAASFKFLHVTGTAKAKSFQLSLDIAEPAVSALSLEGGEPHTQAGRVWAAFDSAPVTIISKPSKKTAKTRNISSCILAGGPVSLFNRINSQTVRTKYMTIEQTQLCASNVTWSAFNVNVVRRSSDAPTLGGPQPVTYGSEIVLSDTHTGISTAPLFIRKVDKGKICVDDGGPVSQMQKIALQRVNPDGSRHYLSAAGPTPGTQGIAPPPAPGVAQSGQQTHALLFQAARVRDEVKDGVRMVTDEVDDYLCWTIVGISKFQYTFFDAFGRRNAIPEMPITPFPTLFTAPVYRPANNTIELTVSNFFYEDPKSQTQVPLEVWLGNLGPLRQRVYQASPPGPLTNIAPFVHPLTSPSGMDGPGAGSQSDLGGSPGGASRYMPQGPLHTIVIVEMPHLADIVKVLQEEVRSSRADGTAGSKDDHATNGQPPKDNTVNGSESDYESQIPSAPNIADRSLPLLFIRASDGIGYHSGRTIALENVFQNLELGIGGSSVGIAPPSVGMEADWLAAAQAAAATADGGMHGWSLRVM